MKRKFELYCEKLFDLGLIDMKLPDMDGEKLMEMLAKLLPGMESIIITGYASPEGTIRAARQNRILGYETKLIDVDRLLSLVGEISERKRMQDQLMITDRLACVGKLAAALPTRLTIP